jgi:hypothetical protein
MLLNEANTAHLCDFVVECFIWLSYESFVACSTFPMFDVYQHENDDGNGVLAIEK